MKVKVTRQSVPTVLRMKERLLGNWFRISWATVPMTTISAATAVAQQQPERPIMMYGYDGFGWGHALFGLTMMVLFWGGLIALLFLAMRWFSAERGSPSSSANRSSALHLLEERFARGEIDKEEFLERKRHLTS